MIPHTACKPPPPPSNFPLRMRNLHSKEETPKTQQSRSRLTNKMEKNTTKYKECLLRCCTFFLAGLRPRNYAT